MRNCWDPGCIPGARTEELSPRCSSPHGPSSAPQLGMGPTPAPSELRGWSCPRLVLNAGVSLLMQKQDPPPCIISSLVLTKPEKETQGEDSEP